MHDQQGPVQGGENLTERVRYLYLRMIGDETEREQAFREVLDVSPNYYNKHKSAGIRSQNKTNKICSKRLLKRLEKNFHAKFVDIFSQGLVFIDEMGRPFIVDQYTPHPREAEARPLLEAYFRYPLIRPD